MAAAPQFKVYDGSGEYQAATKRAEEAALVVGFLGEGATVRWQHSLIVWREGAEEVSAAESIDIAAGLILDRSTTTY